MLTGSFFYKNNFDIPMPLHLPIGHLAVVFLILLLIGNVILSDNVVPILRLFKRKSACYLLGFIILCELYTFVHACFIFDFCIFLETTWLLPILLWIQCVLLFCQSVFSLIILWVWVSRVLIILYENRH
jgi:hypothetical protein